MKKVLEKIITGIITCSGFLTSVVILLIVLFLFSEGFGLFSQKTIEDGYTLVVNKSNPVDELNAKQIKEIFDEDITNWKDVGGTDEKSCYSDLTTCKNSSPKKNLERIMPMPTSVLKSWLRKQRDYCICSKQFH